MSNKIIRLAPETVSTLVATDIQASANGIVPRVEDLAAAISEVQLQTQTLGASLLHVTVIDAGWAIQRTGWLNVTTDGLLDEIDVQYPQGSGMWWRLAMVEGGNDLSSPNLKLTFQDRFVSYLLDKFGPKGVAPGTTTRAQFVKQLVDEVGKGDGLQPIQFVCPAINELQPIQPTTTSNLGTTTVLNAVTAQGNTDKTNKVPGLGHGAQITVQGQTPDHEQITNLQTALSLARQNNASQTATEALIVAGIGESAWKSVPNAHGSPYWGVLQGSKSIFAIDDVTGMVNSFLLGGQGFQAGGAITLSRTQSDPGAIAYQVEGSLSNFNGSVANATGFYDQYLTEAQAIIQAGGGSVSSGLPALSDIAQLTRGTTDNPDESSWECMQRLATEVNWSLFSNGDTLYYMDGPTMAAQKPAAYLKLDDAGTTWTVTNPADGDTATDVVANLTYTFDNTAFLYQSVHKKKGKVQRATRIRTPQTPSQVKFNMICGVLDYRAGDVFVFQNSGPLNGRWIVEDATRNTLADTFTQFTLGPPTVPNMEPQATAAGTALSGSAGTLAGTGAPGSSSNKNSQNIPNLGASDTAAPWEQAVVALSEKSKYVYTESTAPGANGMTVRSNGGALFGPAPRTMDCSAFVTLCYKAGRFEDPNHLGYNPIGNTSSLIAHCNQVSNPQPNDLCFYGGTLAFPAHVTIFVGNGQVISMGKQGDPSEGVAASMGPTPFWGYWRPDVVSGQTVFSSTGVILSNPLTAPPSLPSLWNP